MPLLSETDFKAEINRLVPIYRRDNMWVGHVIKPSWNNPRHMRMFIDAAYRLYSATAHNQLKLTLLGGTEIRKARSLVANFGVTAVNGIQDPATIRIVMNEQVERNNGKGATPADRVNDAGRPVVPVPVVPVRGVGGILSEQHWTPLLNDALIVGGATAEHGFQLALEPGEHELYRQCANNHTIPLPSASVPGLTQAEKNRRNAMNLTFNQGFGVTAEIWKEFMRRNMGMLWDKENGIPRVLARELLGLSFLGYEPVFRSQQIGFQRKAVAPDASFDTYIDGLANLGFEDGANRIPIIQGVSEFLFGGDEKAIYMPEDKMVVTGVGLSPREEARAARYAKMEF